MNYLPLFAVNTSPFSPDINFPLYSLTQVRNDVRAREKHDDPGEIHFVEHSGNTNGPTCNTTRTTRIRIHVYTLT